MAAASNSQIQLMWQRRKILSDIRLFWKVTLPLIPFFTQPLFLTLCALFSFQEEAAIFIEKYCTVNPEKIQDWNLLTILKEFCFHNLVVLVDQLENFFLFCWVPATAIYDYISVPRYGGGYIYLPFEIYLNYIYAIVFNFLGCTWPTS